jgi:DNA repair protein RecO (recombination protein O)
MVELLDRFTPDEEENDELYALLRDGLTWAATAQDLALAARYYELQLLGMAGYQPQLQRCLACDRALQPEDQFFAPAEGGVVCPRCHQADKARAQHSQWLPLSLGALKLLRYIQSNAYPRVAVLAVGPRVHGEVEYLLARYITIILERQLKSVEFLKLIRRDA